MTYVTGVEDQDGYKALLKLWHVVNAQHPDAEEKLVAKAFYPELPIVRGDGIWLDADTFQPVRKDGLAAIIASLPVVQYIDPANGKSKVSPSMLGKFQGGFDLSKYGYPSLVPLRGVDLAEKVRLWRDKE